MFLDPPIAGLNTLVSNELEEEWILYGLVIHYPEHRIVIQLSKDIVDRQLVIDHRRAQLPTILRHS